MKQEWSWYNYIGLSPPSRRQRIDCSSGTDKPIHLTFWDSGLACVIVVMLTLLVVGGSIGLAIILGSGIVQLIKWLPWG